MIASALFARYRPQTNCAGWSNWRHSFDWFSLSKAPQPAISWEPTSSRAKSLQPRHQSARGGGISIGDVVSTDMVQILKSEQMGAVQPGPFAS